MQGINTLSITFLDDCINYAKNFIRTKLDSMQAVDTSLITLPDDCLNSVMNFTELGDLFKITLVCTKFFTFIDETVWQRRYTAEISFSKLDYLTWKQNCARYAKDLYSKRIWSISLNGVKTYFTVFKNCLMSSSEIVHNTAIPTYYQELSEIKGTVNACDLKVNGNDLKILVASRLQDCIKLGKGFIGKGFKIFNFNSSFICKLDEQEYITEIKWHGNDFACGTSKGKLCFWYLANPPPDPSIPICEIQAHQAFISCLQTYNSNPKQLVFSGAKDGSVKAWNIKNHKFENIGCSNDHTVSITSLCYIPNRRLLITGSMINNFISVFDINGITMKKINSYTVHELGVSDIKFNETNVLMTAGYDKQIKLWILTKKTFKIFSRIDLNFFPCEIADYTASADLKQFVITYVAKHAIERITLTVTPQQNSWTHTWIETDSFKYLF